MKTKILVGSKSFFKRYHDFNSKDTDTIILCKHPDGFKNVRQFHLFGEARCVFEWREMSPEEFIEVTLDRKCGMELGKFLVPSFCEYIGFTIEHLKQLEPMLEYLDAKHLYEKIIFEAYIENGAFELSDEQRNKAYDEYKKERPDKYSVEEEVCEDEPEALRG